MVNFWNQISPNAGPPVCILVIILRCIIFVYINLFTGNPKGFLTTAACLDENFFACSRKPNYAKPDYRCPYEFHPYRGQCIHPDFR